MSATYEISSSAYLRRAVQLLATGEAANLFHAAFELRAAIEARGREDLEPWDHIPKKKKRSYNAGDLRMTLNSNHIQQRDKVGRFEVLDAETETSLFVLYHTPMSDELFKIEGKLGRYLHSLRTPSEASAEKLDELRDLLDRGVKQLRWAMRGTLIGLPQLSRNSDATAVIAANIELNDYFTEENAAHQVGKQLLLRVSYLNDIPEPAERNAMLKTLDF